MSVKKRRFKVVHTEGVSDLGQDGQSIKKPHGNFGKKYRPRKGKEISAEPHVKGPGGRKKGTKHSPEALDNIYAAQNKKYQERRAAKIAALGQSDKLIPKTDK